MTTQQETPLEPVDATRWRAALAEATGRGVVVAVLDTGVDVGHAAFAGMNIRSAEVVPVQGRWRCRELDTRGRRPNELDSVGHGTACAGIIHELAPEATLVSVKVMGVGSATGGSGDQLIRGLEWVLEQKSPKIHVANLSLGTTRDKYAAELRKLIDEAYRAGIVVVSACDNMGQPSFPSEFSSLISVDNQSFGDPLHVDFVEGGRPAEVVARGVYVKAPAPGGGTRLFTGTSFACPHVAAMAARLLSANPALKPFHVKSILHALRPSRQT